jgi:fanconi anemia group D2 protein
MTIPILESLSNLNINDEYLEDLLTLISEKMDSAPLEDLPVIIKFLLKSSKEKNAENVFKLLISR